VIGRRSRGVRETLLLPLAFGMDEVHHPAFHEIDKIPGVPDARSAWGN
jgi:hypothetical protein